MFAHLRVDPKTLRARMAENPDPIAPPWINVGSADRPDYRWLAEKLGPWWMELNGWRRGAKRSGAKAHRRLERRWDRTASTIETVSGACVDVIPMARRA